MKFHKTTCGLLLAISFALMSGCAGYGYNQTSPPIEITKVEDKGDYVVLTVVEPDPHCANNNLLFPFVGGVTALAKDKGGWLLYGALAGVGDTLFFGGRLTDVVTETITGQPCYRTRQILVKESEIPHYSTPLPK